MSGYGQNQQNNNNQVQMNNNANNMPQMPIYQQPAQLATKNPAPAKDHRYAILCCLAGSDNNAKEWLSKFFMETVIFGAAICLICIPFIIKPKEAPDGQEDFYDLVALIFTSVLIYNVVGLLCGIYGLIQTKANKFSGLMCFTTFLQAIIFFANAMMMKGFALIQFLIVGVTQKAIDEGLGTYSQEALDIIKKTKNKFTIGLILFIVFIIYSYSVICKTCMACKLFRIAEKEKYGQTTGPNYGDNVNSIETQSKFGKRQLQQQNKFYKNFQ